MISLTQGLDWPRNESWRYFELNCHGVRMGLEINLEARDGRGLLWVFNADSCAHGRSGAHVCLQCNNVQSLTGMASADHRFQAWLRLQLDPHLSPFDTELVMFDLTELLTTLRAQFLEEHKHVFTELDHTRVSSDLARRFNVQ